MLDKICHWMETSGCWIDNIVRLTCSCCHRMIAWMRKSTAWKLKSAKIMSIHVILLVSHHHYPFCLVLSPHCPYLSYLLILSALLCCCLPFLVHSICILVLLLPMHDVAMIVYVLLDHIQSLPRQFDRSMWLRRPLYIEYGWLDVLERIHQVYQWQL